MYSTTEEFVKYLTYEKRYSPHTIRAYQDDLNQFQTFLQNSYDDIRLEEITHSIISTWIVELREKGIQSRSLNRKLSTLKSFFKFLIKERIVASNPMLKIGVVKNQKKLPLYVEEKQTEQLFEEIEFSDHFSGKRDQLMLELFYATGIRLSELINIQIKNIDFGSKTIKVLGKRNKERIIPFGNDLDLKIKYYLFLREGQNTDETYLFVTDKGKKLYPKFVYRKVNHYLSLVTTMMKKSPHILRHTFATHMLNNGADLNSIKTLLGHESLAATQIYTHTSIEKLKSIYKQAHPKG